MCKVKRLGRLLRVLPALYFGGVSARLENSPSSAEHRPPPAASATGGTAEQQGALLQKAGRRGRPRLRLPGQGVRTGRSSLLRPSQPSRVTRLPALLLPTPLSGISWQGGSWNPGLGDGHFPFLCLCFLGYGKKRRVIGWERLPTTVGVQDK